MTEKQLQLFTFIRNYIAHNNKGPSFKDMRAFMKVTSNQTIYDWLSILERENYISRQAGKQFGISLGKKGLSLESTIKFENEPIKPKEIFTPLTFDASTPLGQCVSPNPLHNSLGSATTFNTNATNIYLLKGEENSGSS